MPLPERPPEPWDSFLKALDAATDEVVHLNCIGGFVVTQHYGMNRPTADVDVIELAPMAIGSTLAALGTRGGVLAQKHLVYLDRVSVASLPEDYEARLSEMFPRAYSHLRLMALDPYDLALSKLERDGRKDREDIRFLAQSVPLTFEL